MGLLLSRKGTAKGKGKGDALKGDARDMSRRELSGTRVGCWRFVGPIFFWGVKGVRLVFMLLFLASFFFKCVCFFFEFSVIECYLGNASMISNEWLR